MIRARPRHTSPSPSPLEEKHMGSFDSLFCQCYLRRCSQLARAKGCLPTESKIKPTKQQVENSLLKLFKSDECIVFRYLWYSFAFLHHSGSDISQFPWVMTRCGSIYTVNFIFPEPLLACMLHASFTAFTLRFDFLLALFNLELISA